MAKHAFSFPTHIREALKRHIRKAIDGLDPRRYSQESHYVVSLITRLEGIVYNKHDGYVELIPTSIGDRGPKSAESLSGADMAITAIISDGKTEISKVILIQAKLGRVGKDKRLKEQIRKMKRLTESPHIMEISDEDGQRKPKIISANKVLNDEKYDRVALEDYFVRRILTTLDGDTRKEFVDSVQEGELPQLKILAKIKK